MSVMNMSAIGMSAIGMSAGAVAVPRKAQLRIEAEIGQLLLRGRYRTDQCGVAVAVGRLAEVLDQDLDGIDAHTVVLGALQDAQRIGIEPGGLRRLGKCLLDVWVGR